MNSTDLPVTDWWDPEWDQYDVPLVPQHDPDDPAEVRIADTNAWWAAYDHVETIKHITTGQRWYGPDNFYAHQLTAGPASVPYLGAWPWPCSCEYVVFDCPWPARWAIASGFRIHSDCPQHGDDAHA